ncbi:MAG: NAD(P)/FAD-dependent oxidoreductase [Candidatus Lokiarchaeota archaeon]|nr:NAD(P)/FAD-dependent oxidoreductase [Candidatus Lokiarchaeota archaeon]
MSESNKQKIEDSYDVVVIGAGNGGLTATATLAQKGIKVLCLEQHNLPGGVASSFVRGRFEFETSLHELASYGPPSKKGSIRRLFDDKLKMDTEFVQVPEAFRLITTDPEDKMDVSMSFGVEDFINTIEKEVPGSKKSVENFFKIAKEIDAAFAYFGKTQGKPDQGVLIKEFPNFLKTAAYSVTDVENALDMPERAQKILNGYWAYLGLPMSRMNFTLYAVMVLGFAQIGGWIPINRSHGYTTAIDVKIREFGGRIEYNTTVDKILVEGGQVVGIETSKGDKIKTNYVISNASPTLTYCKLIYPQSEVPEKAFKEINARIHGLTGFVVYAGLDKSAEELGLHDYGYFIMNNMDTEGIYDSWSKLQAPNGLACTILNNAVPDCSPPGTCILDITTLFQPEAWKDVKPEDYVELKTKLAEDLMIKFEEATGSSVRDHIEEIEISTPATFARYAHLFKGIFYGYEPESWDSIVPRLMNMGKDIHIKGLEFAGGFGRRLHGYSSAMNDGVLAAQLTLGRIMKEREKA